MAKIFNSRSLIIILSIFIFLNSKVYTNNYDNQFSADNQDWDEDDDWEEDDNWEKVDQKDELDKGRRSYKNKRYQKLSKDISFQIFTGYPILNSTISPQELTNDEETDINWDPNSMFTLGIAGSYKGIGLSLEFNIPNSARDETLYGNTDYWDLQFHYFHRYFGVDLFYQTYSGFYLDNPADFDSSWEEGDAFTQNSTMHMFTTGANLYYIHSEKFSIKAAYEQSERQMKSGGSFLLMFSNHLLTISNPTSLIPENQQEYYGDEASFSGGSFFTSSLAPGYGHMFVHDILYFAPIAFLGGGVQFQKYDLDSGRIQKIKGAFKFNPNFSLGLNGEKFFTGLTVLTNMNYITLEQADILSMSFYMKLYVGMRF
ncbi:MAG: DUF4421 family protein [Pseudomonadota bacterium]